jgi:hypothetical protein
VEAARVGAEVDGEVAGGDHGDGGLDGGVGTGHRALDGELPPLGVLGGIDRLPGDRQRPVDAIGVGGVHRRREVRCRADARRDVERGLLQGLERGEAVSGQLGDLGVGHRGRGGGHRVGVGDHQPLDGLVRGMGRVLVDVPQPLDVQAVEALQHRAEVHAPRAAHHGRDPVHRELPQPRREDGRRLLVGQLGHGRGPEQLAVVARHRERLGHVAEPAPGEPVHQPAEHAGVLLGHCGDPWHLVLPVDRVVGGTGQSGPA